MVPYLRAANVKDGELDLRDVKMMNFTPEEQAVFSLREGDVLVTEGSGSLASVGASTVWHGELSELVCFQNTLIRLRPRSDRTDGGFLGWWARHAFVDGLFASIANGANIFHISAERVRDLYMGFPPLMKQRAIADFLDTDTARIDMLTDKKRRLIELIRERRISHCEHAILTSSGPSRTVASLGSFVNGWAFKPSDFTPGGRPVVRIRQLTDPTAEPDRFSGELPDTVRLRDGDLVFSWSGSLQVAIWEGGPAYLNQHLFRVTPAPGVDKTWLRFALEASKRLFAAYMHGSAMTHITRSMMKDVRLPMPSKAEQRAIGAELDSSWRSAVALEAKLDEQVSLLTERRRALITAAVTGELDVAQSIAGEAS